LGGEGHLSKCVGKDSRKGAKEKQGKYQPTNKIEGPILRFVGIDYLLICIPQVDHYPRRDPILIIIINISQYWFSLCGFSQGFLPRNFMYNVFGFIIYASAVMFG
jgi:hypothetical protein